MDGQHGIGAGQGILIAISMAVLLLWMDGWSHSVPVMIATSAVALVVFLGFRNAKPKRELTYQERVMLERQSAHRWMASSGGYPEEEPPTPKLTLLDGGKPPPDAE